jgi:hypothetical protein
MVDLTGLGLFAVAITVTASAWAAFAGSRAGGLLAGAALGSVALVPGVLAGDPVLPLSIAALATLAWLWRREGTIDRSAFSGLVPQLGVVVAGYLAYVGGRVLVRGDMGPALANAREIVAFERALGLWIEPAVQDALARGVGSDIFNAIYLFAYYPVPAVALIAFFLRDRAGYRVLRDSLAVSAALALVAIALFPVAPPRLVPGLDLVDTITAGGGERPLANHLAAVPSLHVGWLALVGILAVARCSSAWRYLALIPAFVMAVTVMATGNHYWMDFAVGSAFAVIPALVGLARLREAPEPATGRQREPA